MATTKVVDRAYLQVQFKNFNSQILKPQFESIDTELGKKVVKVEGYGLSKNDFTDELKAKLEGLKDAAGEAALEARIKANEDALAVLNGDAETTGSVAKITADAIAAIVANADEDFDTLKEISDWISGHAESAAAMNSAIQANTTAIAKLNGDSSTEGSVAYAVQQAINQLEYEIETVNIDFSKLDEDTGEIA